MFTHPDGVIHAYVPASRNLLPLSYLNARELFGDGYKR